MPRWRQATAAADKLDADGVLTLPPPLPTRSHRRRHAVANALPRRCHRCQRAANTTVALPAAAALLPICRRCRHTVAPAAASAAAAAVLARPLPPRCRQAAAAAAVAFIFIVIIVADIVAVSCAICR
jgi:hypothetical protein